MTCNKPLRVVLPREKTEKAKINQEENGKKPLATREASKAVLSEMSSWKYPRSSV